MRQPALPAPRLQPSRAGAFDIDVANHRLLRDGRAVPLTPKAYAVLGCLLAANGELVRKQDLFDRVWRDRVVTDAALTRVVRELRRAFDDDAQAPRFIATVHGVGLRWVAGAGRHGARDTAAAPAQAVATPRLAGRDAELADLDQAWQRAREGRREVVIVSGEAGIGKTALLEAFAARAARAGLVVQGCCIESRGEREPYLPWLDVLEQLAQRRGSAALSDLLRQQAPAWLAWLPNLVHERLPEVPGPAAPAPDRDRTPPRLRRELAQALEALAAVEPLLIWLEDLHWSDPSSLDLLALLAARRQPARLLVVASLRPGDAAGAPPASLLASLQMRHEAWELPLAPLPVQAVLELVSQRLGPARDESDARLLAQSVHRRGEGHALFTLALLDDMRLRLRPSAMPDGWVLAGPLSDEVMPASLRRLLQWRIDALPTPEREVFLAASVVGASFAAASLAAALGQALTEVEARCMALAQRGLVRPQPDAQRWPDGTLSAGFSFVHALHHEAARERVTPAWRQQWQGRIAQRLALGHRSHPAALAALAPELAQRFEDAGDVGQALHHVRVAATQALARCAYREAIAVLRRGLSLLAAMPGAARTEAPHEREREELALRLPLGAALMASAGYGAADVRDCYTRALALCTLAGTEADWTSALRGQWNVEFLSCELHAARATATRLLRRAEAAADETLALDAHAKLGQTMLHVGELSAAGKHLQRVLDAPLARDDPALRRAWPRVAAYQTWVHWYSGQAEAAQQLGDRALACAEACESTHSLVFALGYVAWVRLLGGQTSEASTLAQRQHALSDEAGLAYWAQFARFLLGAVAARRGRLAEGIDAMRHAKDDMLAGGGQVGVANLQCLLAEALIDAGQAEAAAAALDDAERRMRDQGNGLCLAEAARLRLRMPACG